jgi:hypothetical protein
MWLFLMLATIPINEAMHLETGSSHEVSGFLVKDSQGDCFLAESPQVRSCCLGKGKVAEMKVEGLAMREPYPLHAVVIRGTIERDEGRTLLKNPEFVESTSTGYAWVLWVLSGCGLIYGFRKMRVF